MVLNIIDIAWLKYYGLKHEILLTLDEKEENNENIYLVNAFMNEFSFKSLKKLTALQVSQHKRHFVARTGELFSICDGAFRRKGAISTT